jgi:hypothetical protein
MPVQGAPVVCFVTGDIERSSTSQCDNRRDAGQALAAAKSGAEGGKASGGGRGSVEKADDAQDFSDEEELAPDEAPPQAPAPG